MFPQCGHSHVLSLQSLQPVLELLHHSVLASTVSLAPSRRTPVGHATQDMSQPVVKERTPSATNPALVSTRWGTHAHVAMCFIHVRTCMVSKVSRSVCLADPCLDGVMNYDETDVDCGGLLCRPCGSHQVSMYVLYSAYQDSTVIGLVLMSPLHL